MKILENTGDFDLIVTDTVDFFFEGADEIGSSDISACVNSILMNFYDDISTVGLEEKYIVRNAVLRAITFINR